MKFKRKKVFVGLLNVNLAIVAFLVILLIFFNTLFSPTKVRRQIKMPDLLESRVDTLQQFLDKYKMDYKIIREIDNWKLKKPAGTILTQIPKSGKEIKEGRKVFITIVARKLTDEVKMPKLIDVPFDLAERTLKNADLDLGKITYKPFLGGNVIMEQFYKGKKIQPNTYVPKGSKIDLVVGNGLGEKEFRMPDLVLMPLDEAEQLLKGYELLVGNITYVYNSKRKLGTVIRQNPMVFVGERGKGVKKGSPMDNQKRTLVRAGELVDLWVVGDPAPKAKKNAGKDDEKDPLEYLDTINIRKYDEVKSYKKRKLDKDKKDR